MSKFDIADILFVDWRVDEISESVVLYFTAPESYLDNLNIRTNKYRNHTIGVRISLAIPINLSIKRFENMSAQEIADLASIDKPIRFFLTITETTVTISPIIETNNKLKDITQHEIDLSIDDIKQCIELANHKLINLRAPVHLQPYP